MGTARLSGHAAASRDDRHVRDTVDERWRSDLYVDGTDH